MFVQVGGGFLTSPNSDTLSFVLLGLNQYKTSIRFDSISCQKPMMIAGC